MENIINLYKDHLARQNEGDPLKVLNIITEQISNGTLEEELKKFAEIQTERKDVELGLLDQERIDRETALREEKKVLEDYLKED